jgi:membrane-bound ClpP family serine protease
VATNVEQLIWKVTGIGAGLAVLGFLLVGVSATNPGGDSSLVGWVGVIGLVVGLAVLMYAGSQWLHYLRVRQTRNRPQR